MATTGTIPDPRLIPYPPTKLAQKESTAFAGVNISLLIISTFFFTGRIWSRIRPAFRLGWDDYIIIVAYVLLVVDSSMLLATIPFAFTGDVNSVTLYDAETSFKLATLAQPIWSWTMAAIKISMAAMILRLQQETSWRRFLWGMIALQVVAALYNTIFQLLQCIPLHAAWDLLGLTKATCLSKSALRINLSIVSVINIISDIIFSLIPISFLRKIQRPTREKVVIGILMGLGILASVASVVKTVYANQLGKTGDYDAEGINIGMWSCIEEQLGMVAACIPCLKSPFQRFLSFLGIKTSSTKSTYGTHKSSGYGKMYGDRSKQSQGPSYRMKSLSTNHANTDAQSEENILPSGVDPKVNTEIWCTTEVQLEEERITGSIRNGGVKSPAATAWEDGSDVSHEGYQGHERRSSTKLGV